MRKILKQHQAHYIHDKIKKKLQHKSCQCASLIINKYQVLIYAYASAV